MALSKIADRVYETDVLVVGGGIAGCPAAWKAAQKGASVILADKANPARSGSSACGIDHYPGFFDRGITVAQWNAAVQEFGYQNAFHGGVPFSDPTRMYRTYANTQWSTEQLEAMGVPMKWTDGKYRFMNADSHWKGPTMRIHWTNVKPIMADACKKAGVKILDHVSIADLLTSNGKVVGALAVDNRSGEFIVIKAKATALATAACSRIYSPETAQPWNYKMKYHWCPSSVSGDGWAMAYRAGAELGNMEIAPPGYRIRDDATLSWGNSGNEGYEARGVDFYGTESRGRSRNEATGPYYQDFSHLPEDFLKRIEVAYVDERMVSFKFAEDRQFNLRTHWFERMDSRINQLHVEPGINVDENMAASMKGLFALGDCIQGSHNVAACGSTGMLFGDTVGAFLEKTDKPEVDEKQVSALKEIIMKPSTVSVNDGTEPMELECALRYATERYNNLNKAEGKLREGIRRIASLRREFLPKVVAKNPHYMARALEVRNLFDVAELHFEGCLNRKETRRNYNRLDYPQQDPALDDLLTYQKLVKGKKVLEMRKVNPMKYPDNHKEER